MCSVTYLAEYSETYTTPDVALSTRKQGLLSFASVAGPPSPLWPALPSVPAIVHIVHEETGEREAVCVALAVEVTDVDWEGVCEAEGEAGHGASPAAVGAMRTMRLLPWSAASAEPFASNDSPNTWLKPDARVEYAPVAMMYW